MNNYFSVWQNEAIFSYKYGYIKRKDAIKIFLKEGYLPFITKHGYTFAFNAEVIGDTIASMIYYNYLYKFKMFKMPHNNYYDENYTHYSKIISYDVWCNFMKYWDNIFTDLFPNDGTFFGQLINLSWEYINLEKSSTYKEYLEDYYYESENDTKDKNIDPYILDHLNRYNHTKFNKFEL